MQTNTADLVIVNGDVRTMAGDETQQALAIRDGRIVFTGTTQAVRELSGPKTEVIDARGNTVLPGFIDAHCHWGLAAKTMATSVYVGTPPLRSLAELIELGRARAAATPPGEWVLLQGSAFQNDFIADRRFPGLAELDQISMEHPVLYRAALHTVVLNRRGLEVSYIDADTTPPPGCEIELDPQTGHPTGVLQEMWGYLPLPVPDADTIRAGLASLAREHLLRHGVTTVHEIWDSAQVLGVQSELVAAREVPLRVNAYGWVPLGGTIERICGGVIGGVTTDPDWFRLKGVKLFADGGTSSRTAALSEDYCDKPGARGELTYSDDELGDLIATAERAGVQIMVHAAGDRSYDQVLRLYEAVGVSSYTDRGPHRIEHCGNHSWTDEFAQRCLRLGVLPVPNVSFISNYGEVWPRSLGAARTERMVPLRSMFDAGLPVPGTSDTTGGALIGMSPMHNIWRAVTRRSYSGGPVSPDEAISLDQALTMYTRNGALAAGDLATRGTLERGKLGDVVLLSRCLSDVPDDELGTVAVDATVVGGLVGHRASA